MVDNFESRMHLHLPSGTVIGKVKAVGNFLEIELDPRVADEFKHLILENHISFGIIYHNRAEPIDPKQLDEKNTAGEISVEQTEGVTDGN